MKPISRTRPHTRDAYPHHTSIPTRWSDADRYGHINNAVYYHYFDTAVNRWLVEGGWLALAEPARIGLVVETGCSFFAPADFPDTLDAGLRVGRVGKSSVRFELALFRDEPTAIAPTAIAPTAIAQGHFTHVYVDARTRRPVALDEAFRKALGTLALRAGRE